MNGGSICCCLWPRQLSNYRLNQTLISLTFFQVLWIVFFLGPLQVQQQSLVEEQDVVNRTLEASAGFISEAEAALAHMDTLVQVSAGRHLNLVCCNVLLQLSRGCSSLFFF